MSLTPGTRLGPYDITAQIGAGGMGQVFRARDTKLNRDVALKVLPDSFANDPDRLARFTREAQTLAALNHPNIAHIHGLEESGGVNALVMELVEGEDLSELIANGARGLQTPGSSHGSTREPGLHLNDALPIARHIADALEAAHEQGIIHRDLKPATIKVRADAAVDRFPVWSPDGARIVFSSNRTGQFDLYQMLTSGGVEKRLMAASDQIKTPYSWSVDGRVVLYSSLASQGNVDLWIVPMALREPQGHPEQGRGMVGDRTPWAFLKSPFREAYGVFSPNGGVDAQQGRQYDVAPDGRFLINTMLDSAAAPITLLQSWNPAVKK